MEAKAVSKNIRISPQKVRQVIGKLRGMNVEKAIELLHFTNRGACEPIEKTVRSAVANLLQHEENQQVAPSDLHIKEIYANEGMTLKRIMPRAMGRAYRIRKRSSHLTVVVSTK
ncbi:MAG: 50S ribosomal protein L22 [Calditrichaeota bacterium]|nr:50S ribosomal protein L22 [Calditrichota bacterium]